METTDSKQGRGFGPHNLAKARRQYQQYRLHVIAERQTTIVGLIEANGAMGVVEIMKRLRHEHSIVIKKNTAKSDLDALVVAERLVRIVHKWDIPHRIISRSAIASHDNELIAEYLAEKEGEGRARNTLYEYNLYLSAFDAYCKKPLTQVTNADIVAWLAEEKKKGLKPTSILARWRSLKIFYRWCVASDKLEKSPLKMKAPKVKREDARIADYASVQKLLAYPVNDWTGYRDRALVHLLLDTGMRIGEALSLPVNNIDFDKHLVHIPAGKDGEARHVPITSSCVTNLQAYLDRRPKSKLDKWLFVGSYPNGNGERLAATRFSTVGARSMLHRLCTAAGVDYINPHSLRHLFATRALNAGMRVEVVSKILGHFSVDLTLRIYARLHTATLQQEYAACWGD